MRALEQVFFVTVLATTIAGAASAGELQTDGAVASTKTDGPHLAVSSPDGAPGLNTDMLDGLHASSMGRSPEKVITVGASGADFSSVAAAVDSIGAASASNPYLIRIGPGSFVESSSVDLPGHIHLQGSATNRAIDQLLEEGKFRLDLFHRIADWTVTLPPLRQRRADIPNFAAYFLAEEAERRGIRPAGISRFAIERLVSYPWPGNLRQLEREMARVAPGPVPEGRFHPGC